MPQRTSENTIALRKEFAARLSEAIDGMSRQAAANKLGVSRQMLNRYLCGKAMPGGEVIRRACAEWKLTLSVRGFEFTVDAFDNPPKRRADSNGESQPKLLGLLNRLGNDHMEAKIVGREGNSLYLELRIKVVG